MGNVYKQSKMEIDGKMVWLKVEYDYDVESPRTAWDGHLGNMVCWHHRYDLGDKHNFDSDTFFMQLAVEFDLLDSPKGEEIRKRMAEKEFSRYSVNFYNEDGESGYDIVAEDLYNPYSRELFETEQEALSFLEEEKQDYINGEAYDEIDEDLARELVESYENLVILPLYLYDHSGITMNTGGFSCRWDSGQVGFIYGTVEKMIEETGGNYKTREDLKTILEGEVETYDQYLTGEIYGFVISEFDLNELDEGDDIEEIKFDSYDHVDSCWGFYGDTGIEVDMPENVEEKYRVLFENLEYAY